MNDKELKAFNAIAQPPDGSAFRFSRVHTMFDPHPYCIGSKHVIHAADHFGGILDQAAIEDAESHGIKCDICRSKRLNLKYSDHKPQLAAVVVLPNDHPKDLNAIPGLVAYLNQVKEAATAAGVEGFMFPKERQESEAAV